MTDQKRTSGPVGFKELPRAAQFLLIGLGLIALAVFAGCMGSAIGWALNAWSWLRY